MIGSGRQVYVEEKKEYHNANAGHYANVFKKSKEGEGFFTHFQSLNGQSHISFYT
ncbi:hypothetical protein GCM10011340_15240 [Roseivirga thermotolerans]|uniref:Uncharacterized protein n=1 Tax=Roseivirga thermotolerans TaxID=1758176 RepID=A0ABQ3I7E8_9BACT|nr:hypothetical protein GCM10011340_15240 [Roseivirga thermotolerans]|tara:strand:- start:316 stop:480 length:165 start_codon:yes stop_codon:yes gene_type:complete